MGIRVHKMCGYALTDVVEDDPRINWESRVFKYDMEGEAALESYLRFVQGKEGVSLDGMMVRERRKNGKKLPEVQQAFEWGTGDGGLESVLCIRPVMSEDWYRHDDTIDWLEETYGGRNQEDRVELLPHGIFPYSGTYMDSRVGDRLPGDVMDWIRIWTNLDDAGKTELVSKGEHVLDEMCERFGMTHQQAERYVVPFVPDDIRWLAEWAEVFTGPDVWRQLRPVVYAWWA